MKPASLYNSTGNSISESIQEQFDEPQIADYATSQYGAVIPDGFSIVDNNAGQISTPTMTSTTRGIGVVDNDTLTLASGNGTAFTQSDVTTGSFEGATYANGVWVAPGVTSNGIYYSANGTNWTQSASATTIAFNGTARCANGVWVAPSTSDGLWYSEDNGVTWTQSAGITTIGFADVFFANGLWVASSTSYGLYYSTDGVTWTQSNITSGTFNIIYYANRTWVVGSSSNGLYYSTDGVTWTQSNITSGTFFVPYYANGTWIASGDSSNGLYYSTDGVTWTQSASFPTNSFRPLFFGKRIWLAGSHNNTGIYYSLNNGVTWATAVGSPAKNIHWFDFANGLFVAGTGAGSGIYYSTDGINWSQATGGTTQTFNHISYANGVWVAAAGASGGLWYSKAGIMNVSKVPVATVSDNATYYPTIVGATSGNNAPKVITGFNINASTGALAIPGQINNSSAAAMINKQYAANSGSAITIDPANGADQIITLNSASVAITLASAPAAGTEIVFALTLLQDNTGGRAVSSWTNVTFGSTGTTPPAINTAANSSTYFTVKGNNSGWVLFSADQNIGVTDGSVAAAGYKGEVISSTVAIGSAVSLTTATDKTITSIILTPGNWKLSGNIGFIAASGTLPTKLTASISTTNNTQATSPNGGLFAQLELAFAASSTNVLTLASSPLINITTTTTYYLVGTGTFTVSTLTGYGSITAERFR